jgi:quercetin dioxygenase-like cupin family protein
VIIRDRAVQLSGTGKVRVHHFFEGEIGPAMVFSEYVVEPGGYGGYHRHDGSGNILYMLSGKLETFQDGELSVLGAGDAILVKSGQAHALRCIGDEPCRAVELTYLEVTGDDLDIDSTVTWLSLPEEISDWE